jgi:hypothetical protein
MSIHIHINDFEHTHYLGPVGPGQAERPSCREQGKEAEYVGEPQEIVFLPGNS